MTLGDMIKKYIREHGLNYEQFGALCGISKGYVSMIVNNHNPKTSKPPIPTAAVYFKIAELFGMTIDELFRIIEDAPVQVGPRPGNNDETLTEDEIIQIREDFRRNPELRTLHSLTRHVTKKEVKQIEAFIRAIRSSNDYEEDDTP